MDLPLAFVFCGRFKWWMHDISSADLENVPSGMSGRWFIRSMKGFFLCFYTINLTSTTFSVLLVSNQRTLKSQYKILKHILIKQTENWPKHYSKRKRKVSITHLYITSNAVQIAQSSTVYIVSAKTFYLYFFIVFPFTDKMKETHWILLYLTKKIHSDCTENRLGLWKLMHHH